MQFCLAQVNIARMLAPIDSPIMHDFVENLDRINALAEQSDGFVWRLKDEGNNSTSIKIFDDNFLIVNMSVWINADSLFQFVYRSDHTNIFRRKKEWFEKMQEMHMALWYVPEHHRPNIEEAEGRLRHIRKHGETPFAFTFRKKFTFEEANKFASC